MIYNINSGYHDKLKERDRNFLNNDNKIHGYVAVSGIKYQGIEFTGAIPLRSNITKGDIEDTPYYVETMPTHKTRDGNVAGFDVRKMIPFHPDLFTKRKQQPPNYTAAEIIARGEAKKLVGRAQNSIDRQENNKGIRDSIAIETAVTTCIELAGGLYNRSRRDTIRDNANFIIDIGIPHSKQRIEKITGQMEELDNVRGGHS